MSPDEHIAEAESLLATAAQWGRGSGGSDRVARVASAHVELAFAIVARRTATQAGQAWMWTKT